MYLSRGINSFARRVRLKITIPTLSDGDGAAASAAVPRAALRGAGTQRVGPAAAMSRAMARVDSFPFFPDRCGTAYSAFHIRQLVTLKGRT